MRLNAAIKFPSIAQRFNSHVDGQVFPSGKGGDFVSSRHLGLSHLAGLIALPMN